jgi:DNA-binding transcriptional regulator YiaG
MLDQLLEESKSCSLWDFETFLAWLVRMQEALNMSDDEVARLASSNTKTVRRWHQNRNQPDRIIQTLVVSSMCKEAYYRN